MSDNPPSAEVPKVAPENKINYVRLTNAIEQVLKAREAKKKPAA